MSISPYPPHVKSLANGNVFVSGRFVGSVDRVQNWGTDHLARVEADAKRNRFFATKTAAVLYLVSTVSLP